MRIHNASIYVFCRKTWDANFFFCKNSYEIIKLKCICARGHFVQIFFCLLVLMDMKFVIFE